MKLNFLLKRLFAFIVGIALFQGAMAQNSITGKVTDQSNGAPLPNVNVTVKGTTRGTTTNDNGIFTITLQPGDATLVFSSTGFTSTELAIDGRSSYDVALAVSSAKLNEVVVVGYGTQSRRDVTGAVASVKGDAIQNLPVSSASQALQGRAAGVNVVRSGGSPGNPGSIRIRGTGTINNADPLIVIDGIPAGDLNSVNPNDIASIEVLKDASASAIYGTRAANGVVIVTTKRGNFEQPMRLNVNAYTGMSNAIKTLDMLDAATLAELKRERFTNDGLTINPVWNDPNNAIQRTNWQDELFKTGTVNNIDVALSGGSAKSSYMLSAGMYDEKGIITNSFFKRYSMRLNSDHRIGKRLKIGQSIQLTRSNDNSLNTLSAQDGLIWSAIRFMPFIPVKNADGSWGSSKASNEFGDINNPIFTANTIDADNVNTRLLANINAEYEILKGLKFKVNLGVDGNHYTGRNFNIIISDQTRTRNNNSLDRNFSESYSLLGEYFLSYSNIFGGKHKVDAVAGYTAQTFNGDFFSAAKRDFLNEDPNQRFLDVGQTLAGIGGNRYYDALQSAFGRINYDYDQRYLFTATFRADGSSKFADGNKWGYFPAFSAGWRISNENFFKSSFIDELKLTAGWGQLGNQNVARLQYLALIGGGGRYSFNNNTVVGSTQTRLPNANIAWETAEMSNIGLNAELFNRRLSVNLNYFDKKTRDMLLAPPTIGTVGTLSIPDQNVGVLQNRGFEMDLSYSNKLGELSYRIGANAAFIKNKVIELFDGNFIGSRAYGRPNEEISRTYEGLPIGIFYGWKTDGLYQTTDDINKDPNISNDPRRSSGLIEPGDVRFVDVNGDGLIDDRDRVNLGSPHPKMVYGFNADFNYKGFDLGLFFLGNAGVKIFNADRMQGIDPTYSFNMYEEVKDRWTGPGTSNSIPRMTTRRNNRNYRTSDMFIEKGDFLRLKNLSIGYTLAEKLTSRMGIGKTRFYITGQNVFTFTKYSGLDPELGYTDGNRQINVDYAQYPQSRSWIFGLNVTF
ncbi:TonB-dependent receptor [Flavihumibacter sp. CACIAM 22H1]|uniref:SusC/RagA family TonB-linked outer membrane protein n=1 Tax=Flavihumibacter sp. CACIAM 22H1 TaxID=1812911 RepID=UPI0007A8B17E|nr:TonB-dependent receptor [Flavihumibacter sp. CACIAM 22H1]KYP15165.1 MAG: SusC/RagA family TonB-linked outer membrane protein [Flavihumibacter sp. CACIAM 22H1]